MVAVYKDIANRTGGMFIKIPGSPQEMELYKFIKSKQDKRYIVSYKSKLNPDLSGRYIDLEVSAFYRDVVGRAQSGFSCRRNNNEFKNTIYIYYINFTFAISNNFYIPS